MHILQTIRTGSYIVNCIVQYVNCIYAPQYFHEHKHNSKTEILLATCSCIYIAQAYLLFKIDEFDISKGALLISYTVVCGVSQFNLYNKVENNYSIISIISNTLATGPFAYISVSLFTIA